MRKREGDDGEDKHLQVRKGKKERKKERKIDKNDDSHMLSRSEPLPPGNFAEGSRYVPLMMANSISCRFFSSSSPSAAGTRSFLISSVARWSLTRARFSVSSTVMRTCSSSLRCSQLGLPRFCSSCPFVSCHVQNQKNSSCRVHIVNHSNNYNDGNRLLQHSYQFLLLFINYYQ